MKNAPPSSLVKQCEILKKLGEMARALLTFYGTKTSVSPRALAIWRDGESPRQPISKGPFTMRTLCFALFLMDTAPVLAQPAAPNSLSAKEIADGWLLLFDGESTFGWRTTSSGTL